MDDINDPIMGAFGSLDDCGRLACQALAMMWDTDPTRRPTARLAADVSDVLLVAVEAGLDMSLFNAIASEGKVQFSGGLRR